MFTDEINTRFCDTDALGHINNTMIPRWFEGARDHIFKMFTPDLDISQWRLILAKIDVIVNNKNNENVNLFVRRSFSEHLFSWMNDSASRL